MCRAKLYLLLVALLCAAGQGLLAQEPSAEEAKPKPPEIGAELIQILPVFKPSDDLKTMRIHFALRNVGDKPIVIASNGVGSLIGGMGRLLVYQNGKPIPWKGWSICYGSPPLSVARILNPGEYVEIPERIHLHYHYPELKPGRYEIRASYNSCGFRKELLLTPIRITNRLVGYLEVEEEKVEPEGLSIAQLKDLAQNAQEEKIELSKKTNDLSEELNTLKDEKWDLTKKRNLKEIEQQRIKQVQEAIEKRLRKNRSNEKINEP